MDECPPPFVAPVDDGRATERLFFALWPSPEIAAELAGWGHAAHSLCGGRIMQPETLHMTLAFLGNTPRVRVDELVHVAADWPVSLGALTLRRLGRFKRPNIVWAGPADGDTDRIAWLDSLYDMLWIRLESMGWHRPESAFRPHVSLLRNAGPGKLDSLSCSPIFWRPEQCVLVASRPNVPESRYQVLVRLPIQE
ncbi:RNA 2',3'-cyclic phosphodiesterase [Paralcaligenes sp. KSB-10]|uniref:RNA 2',3'-cyclic phosphodiesterase n=1 Tax=Paralcaligenes sp. KSB-10 TaxID=2901142 RepID=UPI001E45E1F6|nr:RNA 2',3'-cyclic phosphodiesterase [Paralcaligenes sp. KSB-10]UHL63361.1 RNA 2',3'-cyclic phosphodiesterase [Paralcaligenes sp. KSB-10]